jgi:hypothetical protein
MKIDDMIKMGAKLKEVPDSELLTHLAPYFPFTRPLGESHANNAVNAIERQLGTGIDLDKRISEIRTSRGMMSREEKLKTSLSQTLAQVLHSAKDGNNTTKA